MAGDPTPLIAVSACVKTPDGRPTHTVGEKYLTAITDLTGATPLILPALGERMDLDAVAQRLDGLVLTGSPSNVFPSLYGEEPSAVAEPHDPARDATTLPMILAALRAGLPILAICRGFQEMNVALGGTLHPQIRSLEGRDDHRRPQSDDVDVQYGPKHAVTFIAGGVFERIAGTRQIQVNSLHNQGILALAPGLVAEGVAPDGTIEAISARDAKALAVGVQWHPEYKAAQNDFSRRLYGAFAEAARQRAAGR